ncbi:unnamed protein product [Rhizoctonia solani]|uniref:EXS domain-containing protein n=1 Tax=Rhizoctonia solani TaxID=456999 RepID=A0A8H2XPF8_9AGAM|nr:unnamed protein product [Rhizoctonia solani]
MAHNPPAYHESTSPTQIITREPPSYEPDPALPLPTTFKIGKSYTPPLISVSSVRKHLLLLSCFSTLRRNVENAPPSLPLDLDPEVKWAIYLVRADYRFGLWIDKVVNRFERQRGEVAELTDAEIPPIDVLLLLHAYLLNPVAYYEDSESRYPYLKLMGGFPLDRVGSKMRKDEEQVYYTPTPAQIEEWELRTREPFELSLFTTLSDTVTLSCPICTNPDIQVPWLTEPIPVDPGNGTAIGKGYAQSGFSIECQACGENVTKGRLRAERFVKEFVRVRNGIRRGKETWFVNSLINPHTYKPSSSLASNFTKLCVEGIHDLDENPRLSANVALGSYFDWDLSEAQRLIEAGFKRTGSTRAWMGDSISRLFRAFRHNSSVSIDLPGSALRQQKFIAQILPLSSSISVTDLITQYHSFLDLCAHNSGKALVPTLVIDLGWHTHMLSGEVYRNDCWRFFEKVIGHEDKVEEGKLASSFDETARLWRSRFGENYSTCGCTPVQSKPSPSLRFWKKSTPSLESKPETHPTEHNSIVAVNPKKAVAENRRSRAGSVSVPKDEVGSVVREAGHAQAFVGDYANADGKPFSSLGVQAWDIDCIRQPFVVDSNEDRGDCCVVRCTNIMFHDFPHVRNWGRSDWDSDESYDPSRGGGCCTMNNPEDAPFHVDLPVFHSSFPLPYRVFLLVGLGIFFWATNLHVLHLLGIDTIWVLDLRRDKVQSSSPPTPLPTARQPQLPYDIFSLEAINLYKSVYKIFVVSGAWIGLGWLYFRLITAGDAEAMDMYKILPALTGIGLIVGLICPLDVLMKRERMRFLRALWRCLSSPSSDPVYFSDVILADVFTSFAKVIADAWISICMLFPKGTLLRAKTMGGMSESLVPIMMALPYAIRFRQCMMEYIGSQRKSGRALANAIKYATAFPVIFLSVAQRTSPTGPLDAKSEGEISSSGYFDHKIFKLWLLAVVINSVYSFWWDVTNDWGLTLLKPSTWPAQHATMPPRSPLLRPPRSGRSSPPLILLSRTNSLTGLSAAGSTYSDADGIMRERAPHPFGLRDNLLFRDSLVYYLVIFLNLFLRFTWSLKLSTHLDTVEELESSVFLMEALEITRRWVWVFFRVEWEAIKKEQAGDVSARIRPVYTPGEEIEFDFMGSSRGPSRALTPDPLIKLNS